ncbi:hypothetical protein CDAR_422171 [Caerostris darwini]|uniref:Uncharacterized protein n=1 Tax=Caerostris darwini TaxID=1538125 RepID=A0AAV4WVF9_9ARAC|nr:hypothetical protein CDAR_422171 [Caerostris darwini]
MVVWCALKPFQDRLLNYSAAPAHLCWPLAGRPMSGQALKIEAWILIQGDCIIYGIIHLKNSWQLLSIFNGTKEQGPDLPNLQEMSSCEIEMPGRYYWSLLNKLLSISEWNTPWVLNRSQGVSNSKGIAPNWPTK